MVIFKRVISFWDRIKRFGIGEDSEENEIISLINQMGVIGVTACSLMAIVSIVIGMSIIYTILALVFGSSVLLTIILNVYNKTYTSKLIIGISNPILISVYIILSGGSFGEESILTVSLFIIFILFRRVKPLMFRLYLITAISYSSAQLYLFFFPPILNITNNPYDNIIAFVVCAMWLLVVIYLHEKQLARQKKHQDFLIKKLKLKNATLKKTSEELEQFTYIASHDLKSPLRTIISFLDLIKRDISRERYDDLNSKLDFVRSGAEQMNYLVTDILEYSKITNGTKREKKLIPLQSIIDRVKFNLAETIEKKNVDLYVFPLPDFYCNETEMTVLFQNFIENGIKYNEEPTPNIFVKSKIEKDQLILQFIDNGIGIDELYFEKIFLFFKRLHTNEVYKGTGLGLGLCKKIIDDMGGRVSVKSTINVGSTFTINLPIKALVERSPPLTILGVQDN